MPTGRDRSSASTRPQLPVHVFTPEYLVYLAHRDEPETAPEADTAGPWHDMRYFDADFLAVLNVLDAVAVSPHALALLLDAVGGLALERLDKIAVARLEQAAG